MQRREEYRLKKIKTHKILQEIEVKMLNKGEEGKMVFEPSFIKANKGDTIIFLPTDKGHMAASIKGMIPKGAKSFKSKINKKFKFLIFVKIIYLVYLCI